MKKGITLKRRFAVLAMAVVLICSFCVFENVYAAEVVNPATNPGKASEHNELFAETSAINLVNDQKAGKYKLLSTAKLKSWMDSNKSMVIIDTMPKEKSYDLHHIPGAKNVLTALVPNEKFTSAQKKALVKAAGKNKNKTIVVYCGFTSCRRSHFAAQYLVKKGYKKVYRQVGGIFAWMDAGYPIEGSDAQTTPTTPAAETPATPAA